MNGQNLIRVTTIAQLSRGAAWRMELQHSYDTDMILWITRGQGRGVLQGVRRGIGTHNLIWVPAGVCLSLDLGKQGSGIAVEIPAGQGLGFPPDLLQLRVRDVHAQLELTAHFDVMARELREGRPYADEALRAEAALVSVWLRRQLLLTPPEPRETASERLARAYAALMAQEFHRGRSMADLAQDLGVTPTHLSRVCKDVAGQTAADLLTERLVHAARDRIERTDLPFQVIAADLGFGSAAYFTRFVQTHTKQSPTALRRAARK